MRYPPGAMTLASGYDDLGVICLDSTTSQTNQSGLWNHYPVLTIDIVELDFKFTSEACLVSEASEARLRTVSLFPAALTVYSCTS